MNKSTNAPRKLYSRKGSLIVCFEGRVYAAKKSKLDAEKLAKCEKMPSDGGK